MLPFFANCRWIFLPLAVLHLARPLPVLSEESAGQVVYAGISFNCGSCRQIDAERCEKAEISIWREIPCIDLLEQHLVTRSTTISLEDTWRCFRENRLSAGLSALCGETLLNTAAGQKLLLDEMPVVMREHYSQLLEALEHSEISSRLLGMILLNAQNLDDARRRQLAFALQAKNIELVRAQIRDLPETEADYLLERFPSWQDLDAHPEEIKSTENTAAAEDKRLSIVIFLASAVALACLALPLYFKSSKAKSDGKEERSTLFAYFSIADNASEEMLRQSYHRLAKELHPDSAGGDRAAFIELKRKYELAKEIIARGGDER